MLVVALLILMVMTVLGVSMLSSSTMEERMASNLQSKNVTFQAAESCVRTAFLPGNEAARQNVAVVLEINPNADTSAFNVACNFNNNTVPATVTYSLPTNFALMSGYEVGKQYPLALTGTSTLASGASSSIQAGILQKGL